ncbi:MAG: transcription-repair coupling factor [Candidatus Syntrophonatronum acetioxidans]|uniref:Transcription-repair-coupling factor n=1 Tax=Candidatus Syntrophonatronum acetioxidans TaxID=1795816 RepID=A0A424YC29_9FIRM|nr:MAG: transcription-repair coupling factor [Candidatus Syntrophonatronum acetioxidans]
MRLDSSILGGMNVSGSKLLSLLFSCEKFNEVVANLKEKVNSQLLYGMDGSQKNYFLSGVKKSSQRPALVVTTHLERAEEIYGDLLNFFPEEKVMVFPPRENIYHETLTYSKEVAEQRMAVLEKVLKKEDWVVVAPVASLLSLLPPRNSWERGFQRIKKGEKADLDLLKGILSGLGYERVPLVEGGGQFSIRGGILDFFPLSSTRPLRMEFFDDEVESIREFDPVSQRSERDKEEVNLSPLREMVLQGEEFQRGVREIEKDLRERLSYLNKAGNRKSGKKLSEKIEKHLEKLKEGIYFEGIEQYLPYFFPYLQTFLDYLRENTLVFWDEPLHISENGEKLWQEIKENNSSLLAEGIILPRQEGLYGRPEEFLFKGNYQQVSFSLLMSKIPGFKIDKIINIPNKTMSRFYGKWDILEEELKHWFREGYRVFIMASTSQRCGEVVQFLERQNIKAVTGLSKEEDPGERVEVIPCSLENGFVFPHLKLALIGEQEIIPQRKKKRVWKSSREGVRISDYHELEIGDYVVHEHHGIGQYLGVRTLEINGVNRDYLCLKYGGEDKLFIPTDQMDLVRKYIGGEGKKPRLHSLDSNEWTRVKNRVKESVQKLARELLSLYASRQAVEGHAFSTDHQWQRDFEARFPYQETEDQLKAIIEVKEDMEKSRPMDRLICGDVGYGKTEVAMRAAFKGVMDGKQVAFLVPTTILAQQHYQSFKERFAGFPVNIEVISRFKTPAQQKEILRQIKSGWTDVIIGTHRLLSSDVSFKDLGLLIVDEEQRFGVRHKEKLKMLRREVDVLTMTATPIPRTLHMSLVGVRDLSVIETPPENRYPIQTYVAEYSESLIREALLRELNRGGQAFFVYNRVETIEKWGKKLKELIPEARIAIGHGQMPESKLEKVMFHFLNKDYDLLLCSTIIEAGLDIPNVNTMVIYDADKMGLAQLYQLKGRVGRSSRLAYAYLTYQKDKVLSQVAEKRLQAIKEFTELGSGFKIALRDLEIRGAGNLLGPEQHGFMEAVGFDLYCQLLEQSIREMKGIQKEEVPETKIELNVNAYVPSQYITHHSQKMQVYQRIASLGSQEEVQEMEKELEDRYGRIPPPVENLLAVTRIKLYSQGLFINSIVQDKDKVVIKFHPSYKPAGEDLLKITSKFPGQLTLLTGKQTGFRLNTAGCREESLLERLLFFCREIYALADKETITYN